MKRCYRKWNRTFGVHHHEKSGKWYAGGKDAGRMVYVLDKLGMCETRGEMQGKLDVWARRVAAVEVLPKGVKRLRQGRFF